MKTNQITLKRVTLFGRETKAPLCCSSKELETTGQKTLISILSFIISAFFFEIFVFTIFFCLSLSFWFCFFERN